MLFRSRWNSTACDGRMEQPKRGYNKEPFGEDQHDHGAAAIATAAAKLRSFVRQRRGSGGGDHQHTSNKRAASFAASSPSSSEIEYGGEGGRPCMRKTKKICFVIFSSKSYTCTTKVLQTRETAGAFMDFPTVPGQRKFLLPHSFLITYQLIQFWKAWMKQSQILKKYFLKQHIFSHVDVAGGRGGRGRRRRRRRRLHNSPIWPDP